MRRIHVIGESLLLAVVSAGIAVATAAAAEPTGTTWSSIAIACSAPTPTSRRYRLPSMRHSPAI